jgi:hypothetical protein
MMAISEREKTPFSRIKRRIITISFMEMALLQGANIANDRT